MFVLAEGLKHHSIGTSANLPSDEEFTFEFFEFADSLGLFDYLDLLGGLDGWGLVSRCYVGVS